jgi:ribosomal subunit interface protein
MRHNIEFKHFEPKERVRDLIEELISHLERHVQDFPEETVFLRVLVEENAVRTLYHVSITLDLPGRILAAKEERHDADEAIRDAFAEIERQAEKHKASSGSSPCERQSRFSEQQRILRCRSRCAKLSKKSYKSRKTIMSESLGAIESLCKKQ